MKLIYVGAHPSVDGSGFRAVRHGDPVCVPEKVARGLIARGDFIEFVPEPRRQVEKSRK